MNDKFKRTKRDVREEAQLNLIETGSIVSERYKLMNELGVGGFGQVYRAYDLILKKEVALKFLSPDVINSEKKFIRVKREINISQKITDESIVKIFSLEEWNDSRYLVMELVEGRTLKEILQEKGKLEWSEFREIFLNILRAVGVLHKSNIIHRDLKPSNIMITSEGSVKLLDFGLSKEINDFEKTSSIGEIVGSPYYMSPEQISMNEIDQRSDIYQLGLILYKALSGELPFSDDTSTLDLLYKRISDKPRKISETGVKLPAFLEFGILKAMEKERSIRFQSINEVLSYFEKERYPFMGKTLIKIKKHPLYSAAILLLLTILVTSAFYIRKNSLEIGSIDYHDSTLTALNSFGVKLFEKDYPPYNIIKPEFHKISKNYSELKGRDIRDNYLKSDSNIIALFLMKKNLYGDIIRESVKSDKYASAVFFVDRSGKTINKKYFHMTNSFSFRNEFSGWMNFQHIRKMDVDLDGKKELLFETCHNMSMFPAQFILLDDIMFRSLYSPGHFNFIKALKKKKSFTFLISGRSNPFCHMNYIAEINMKKDNRINLPPNIINNQNGMKFDFFYILIPKDVIALSDSWEKEGKINFIIRREGSKVSILKDYSIIIEKEGKINVYRDDPGILSTVYSAMNEVYKKKIVEKDYEKSYEILKESNFNSVKNPFLLSVLYYYKGDLEILLGRNSEGEVSLNRSISYYPNNNDAIQRRMENHILSGRTSEIEDHENDFLNETFNFYGLSYDGAKIFYTYFCLMKGEFRKAEKVSKLLKIGSDTLLSYIELFRGGYKTSLDYSKRMIGVNTKPFTLEEARIDFARSVLLSNLFDGKGYNPDDETLKLAGFYFKDIADNSVLNSHLADISASFFLTETEDRKDLTSYTKKSFNKLIKMSKGDMITRLWLFYDAFIYAKVMEKLGNKIEAVRGYRVCIKANPHTDLAKRASGYLRKMLKQKVLPK